MKNITQEPPVSFNHSFRYQDRLGNGHHACYFERDGYEFLLIVDENGEGRLSDCFGNPIDDSNPAYAPAMKAYQEGLK